MRLTSIPRIKRISLAVRKPRRRVICARKARYRMNGGPVSEAWLCTPGTLLFRIGAYRGFYDNENKWVQIDECA